MVRKRIKILCCLSKEKLENWTASSLNFQLGIGLENDANWNKFLIKVQVRDASFLRLTSLKLELWNSRFGLKAEGGLD